MPSLSRTSETLRGILPTTHPLCKAQAPQDYRVNRPPPPRHLYSEVPEPGRKGMTTSTFDQINRRRLLFWYKKETSPKRNIIADSTTNHRSRVLKYDTQTPTAYTLISLWKRQT